MKQIEFPYARTFNLGVEIDEGMREVRRLEESCKAYVHSLNINSQIFKYGLSGALALTTWHYLGGDILGTISHGFDKSSNGIDFMNSLFVLMIGATSVVSLIAGGLVYSSDKSTVDIKKSSISQLKSKLEGMITEEIQLYERHFLAK